MRTSAGCVRPRRKSSDAGRSLPWVARRERCSADALACRRCRFRIVATSIESEMRKTGNPNLPPARQRGDRATRPTGAGPACALLVEGELRARLHAKGGRGDCMMHSPRLPIERSAAPGRAAVGAIAGGTAGGAAAIGLATPRPGWARRDQALGTVADQIRPSGLL